MGNYSVDQIKKQSYTHEINNVLKLRDDIENRDTIITYLENRIKEIDKEYK